MLISAEGSSGGFLTSAICFLLIKDLVSPIVNSQRMG